MGAQYVRPLGYWSMTPRNSKSLDENYIEIMKTILYGEPYDKDYRIIFIRVNVGKGSRYHTKYGYRMEIIIVSKKLMIRDPN